MHLVTQHSHTRKVKLLLDECKLVGVSSLGVLPGMSAKKAGEPQGFSQRVAEILIWQSYYLRLESQGQPDNAGPQHGKCGC